MYPPFSVFVPNHDFLGDVLLFPSFPKLTFSRTLYFWKEGGHSHMRKVRARWTRARQSTTPTLTRPKKSNHERRLSAVGDGGDRTVRKVMVVTVQFVK